MQLFNSSVRSNTYPSHWECGQVTPVFKKSDENLKSNYRSITGLAAFNNVLERLLSIAFHSSLRTIVFRINFHPIYRHIEGIRAAKLPQLLPRIEESVKDCTGQKGACSFSWECRLIYQKRLTDLKFLTRFCCLS